MNLIKKIINANKNTYILFIGSKCHYCELAIERLRNSGEYFKAYDVNRLGGRSNVLHKFNKYKHLIKFKTGHITIPIIFLNGRFVGGYKELNNILSNR